MPSKKRHSDSLALAKRAVQLASDKQAVEIVLLDLRKVTDFADYFIVCTGVVDVHVRAIYDYIDTELRKEGIKPKHIEGETTSKWVLMDYFDVVINIFQPTSRGYYALEKLWGDASYIDVSDITKGFPNVG